ncbi:hypothetical protein PR003_g8690 [Phytophthora rubi]|uniref:Uncharacterized protein n=1 Tax=Phytophthora rubi TaxID=129364 RepID=A0A6A3NBI1_9STRA|nr:hypothetical protein PR002_g13755 [Phytophthora rubi]KAE9038614.1 hypothetical protein PR001_g7877 [Phytophthora rubi]KAE9343988.1 hypothetical protein PR003_g8690 [Phytophthora rubi]
MAFYPKTWQSPRRLRRSNPTQTARYCSAPTTLEHLAPTTVHKRQHPDRLYNCYVLPILLYNYGTWALTPAELASMESFHCRQLRSVLNVRYTQRMSNAVLYEICQERPLRHRVIAARWRLFGHILRRPDTPVYVQTAAYFAPSDKGFWRVRLRTTLPTVLNADLVSSGYAYRLRTRADLEQLRSLANAKSKWKALERAIIDALPAKRDPAYADTTLCRRLANLSLGQA